MKIDCYLAEGVKINALIAMKELKRLVKVMDAGEHVSSGFAADRINATCDAVRAMCHAYDDAVKRTKEFNEEMEKRGAPKKWDYNVLLEWYDANGKNQRATARHFGCDAKTVRNALNKREGK